LIDTFQFSSKKETILKILRNPPCYQYRFIPCKTAGIGLIDSWTLHLTGATACPVEGRIAFPQTSILVIVCPQENRGVYRLEFPVGALGRETMPLQQMFNWS
jgi:hypothetical protein